MHPRKSYAFFCWATNRRAFCNTLLALRTVWVIWVFVSVKLRSYAIHCLSISRSYALVTTLASTPWAVQLFRTDALHRAVAVLYRSAPRWLLMLVVLLLPPNNDARSKPVLLKLKSNRPDKSRLIPVSVVVVVPAFTSTIMFLMRSRSFFSWVLSEFCCMANSASVCLNSVSTSSEVRPMY